MNANFSISTYLRQEDTGSRRDVQADLTSGRYDDPFLAQFAQGFLEVAFIQLPAIAEGIHVNLRVQFAREIKLEGKEDIVAIARQ